MTELSSPTRVAVERPDLPQQRSPLYYAWRRFASNKGALGAGIVILGLVSTRPWAVRTAVRAVSWVGRDDRA